MKKVADFRITEFFDVLKGRAPTPGGGAVAALTAASSAALLSMSANFTVDNEKYKEYSNVASEVIKETNILIEELKALASADMLAFQSYSDTMALKKDTDEEKEYRRLMIQSALVDCMNVPMQIAEASYNLLNIAKKLALNCNPNLVSDVAVANDLAIAALNSALLNVKINLKYIKDESVISYAKTAMKSFDNRLDLYKEIAEITNKIMDF